MSRAAVDNARLIVDALRWPNTDHVQAIRLFAITLVGSVSIKTLTDATIPGPPGMQAVLCLLAEGLLELIGLGFAGYASQVKLRLKSNN